MKNTILILVLLFSVSFSAQILQTEASNTQGSSSMAFIDGSSAVNYNAFPGAGKGILFPRTDLTVIAQADIYDTGSLGSASYNPNYYDGLIVFNTGTGAIPATGMGTSTDDVSPGFYFYRNTGTAWNTGVWKPMNGGTASVAITENTAVATNVVTTSADAEQVISLTGSADGVSTHIDLGTTILAANTVKQFRKAIVYDATGYLVIVATGSYDVTTNKFVTGNGMTNILLPAAEDYKVELYYSENIEEEGF